MGRSSPIGAGGHRTTDPFCQGGCRRFDPGFPLQQLLYVETRSCERLSRPKRSNGSARSREGPLVAASPPFLRDLTNFCLALVPNPPLREHSTREGGTSSPSGNASNRR